MLGLHTAVYFSVVIIIIIIVAIKCNPFVLPANSLTL